MNFEPIETRTPTAESWVRQIDSVDQKAKTGHDYDGPFLKSGQLVDLLPGTLVIGCDTVGSRKHPRKLVKIWILRPSGKWTMMEKVEGAEWAYEARQEVRRLLDLSSEDRICEAYESIIKTFEETRALHASDSDYDKNKREEITKNIESTQKGYEKFKASVVPIPINEKEFQFSFTEDEAHAIGYSLMHTLKELKGKYDDHALDLISRLESVSSKLENSGVPII